MSNITKKFQISFDLWGTLIKPNPAYKAAKIDLVLHYSKNKSQTKEEIERKIKIIKKSNDTLVESTGNQPTIQDAYFDLAALLEIPIEFVHEFREDYIQAFREIGVNAYSQDTVDVIEQLHNDGHILHISSNTAFIPGYGLRENV